MGALPRTLHEEDRTMAGQRTGPRLTRDLPQAMLGGVCAGFARRYDFDVTLLRIVMVLLAVATGGMGVPLSIAAWIIMPREDAQPPATPEGLSHELRDASDRLTSAARVLADKTREAAEEISAIARRAPAAPTPPPPAAGPTASAPPAPHAP